MTRPTPETLLTARLRNLQAYHVADAKGLVKLDAMEVPYPWPPELVEDWTARLRETPVNRYPDPAAHGLKAALRETLSLPTQAALLLGNGSDELIQLLGMAVTAPGRCLLAPTPSFAMYSLVAAFTGLEFVGVPLRPGDFSLDTGAMLAAMARHRPALTFIAYPNNPTGNLFDEAAITALLEAAPGLVVLDEAYFAFAGQSFVKRLPDYPHLLVMRTLSKVGLAGLRVGFLLGGEQWLNEFEKLRLPYNINSLSQCTAEFALAHWPVLEANIARIGESREMLGKALRELPDLSVYPSAANFFLVRTAHGQGDRIHTALRKAGILVKNFGADPQLHDCLRITVGTPSENRQLISALRAIL